MNPPKPEVTGQVSCQNATLRELRDNKIPVSVYLASGIKLTGLICAFCDYTVLLRLGHKMTLVFKHAIGTIMATIDETTEQNHGENDVH